MYPIHALMQGLATTYSSDLNDKLIQRCLIDTDSLNVAECAKRQRVRYLAQWKVSGTQMAREQPLLSFPTPHNEIHDTNDDGENPQYTYPVYFHGNAPFTGQVSFIRKFESRLYNI